MSDLDSLYANDRELTSMPENMTSSHEIFKNQDGWLISNSKITVKKDTQWSSTAQDGLSIGIVQGKMQFELNKGDISSFNRCFAYCLMATEPLTTVHSMHANEEISGIFLSIPLPALAQLQARNHDIENSPIFQNVLQKPNNLQSFMPNDGLIALCHDLFHCHYQGTLRSLYFEGKAIELLVKTMENLSTNASMSNHQRTLSHHDMERFMHIRDILVTSLTTPPSLDQLSRQVGISTSRLTAGFRQVFSMSVVEFIQQQRLERAFHMLRDEKIPIAQVAYKIGYSPAHFSTLFRRQYGYPPSQLYQQDTFVSSHMHP